MRYFAFGRSDGCLNNEERAFWIVLRNLHDDSSLKDSDSDIIISRDSPLGAILIQNFEGEHAYNVSDQFGDVHRNNIKIYNRAKYVPAYDENVLATDILINISGDRNTYLYRNLSELIDTLTSKNQQIKETQEVLEKVIKEQKETQEILAKSEAEQKERQKKLLEEEENLRKKLEKEKYEQRQIIVNAQNFIRQNAELRWQPILDPIQDKIKREKILDGGTLIINGGPGTGKTTSLIQRIKFLTSKTIEKYIILKPKQKEILYKRNSWIFFSPSKLLALYLQNSMAREELNPSDSTVKVWKKYSKDIIRFYGWVEEKQHLDPDGSTRVWQIFKFYQGDQTDNNLFIDKNSVLDIAQDFEKYYLRRQTGKLLKINDTGYSVDKKIKNFESLLQAYFRVKLKREQMKRKERIEEERKKGNDQINDTEINEDTIFNRTVNILFNNLPSIYKMYRRKQYKQKNKGWNNKILGDLIKDKDNPFIHHDEQSLLIYIVNKFCREVYMSQHFSTYWKGLKHLCILTYSDHCKPVIAIDEATDFSAVDLLAMHSFRHPEISSVTLSGDLMQRMTSNGINEWEDFSNSVDDAIIENLTMSFRQSPTLLSLAQKIYRYSTGKKAEYISYFENNPAEPKSLMKISNDTNEKIKWISDRIKEIDIVYRRSVGSLPSVAVFVPGEEDITAFANRLEIELGSIPVQECKDGMVLGESSDVRVYAIDKIKGLEFEAVFFHNLDQLDLENNLFLKYLYVGLSRASCYLGITLSENLDSKLHFIEECFVQNENWVH